MDINRLLDVRESELAEGIRGWIRLDGPIVGHFVLIRYKENEDCAELLDFKSTCFMSIAAMWAER